MIDVGKVVEFDGDEGIICFKKIYNDKLYVNVCFGTGQDVKYEIYEVKNIDGKLAFILEENPEVLSELTFEFTMESLNENLEEGD